MTIKFKAKCERVRPNNGIVEALFTHHPDISDPTAQEEHVLVNLHVAANQFQEGQHYWIEIAPEFPH